MGKQDLGAISASDRIDDLILVNSVQGAFPGSVLPSTRIEALIAAHVPRKQIADVADVYAMRWWDYRRLAPGHSFMLFAHTYYSSFRLSARKFLAHRHRDHAKVALVGAGQIQFKAEEVWDRDQAHITGLWKAMLTADSLGMPYDQFCRLGFNVAIDTAWTRLPNPWQLYSEKMGAMIYDAWLKAQEDRIFFARHPIYSVENYAGSPLQDEYRSWLIEQIQGRDHKLPALVQAVYQNPQLPEAEALQLFPASVMKRASLLA